MSEAMKSKFAFVFALVITLTALTAILAGCGNSSANLAAENANLKARVQKLEQQLKAANQKPAPAATDNSAVEGLKGQLDEAQKSASTTDALLKSLTDEINVQKAKIDDLTRQLAAAQQARDKAVSALQLYQDTATSALKQFQALRSTLGDKTLNVAGYRKSFPAAQTAVTQMANALPESKVRRQIMAVLASFTHLNDTCNVTDQQVQARTAQAKAEYDKLIDFGGLGPNPYVIKMGKDRILAPAEQANSAALIQRNQQVVAQEKDLDQGLKNLQFLVTGQSS